MYAPRQYAQHLRRLSQSPNSCRRRSQNIVLLTERIFPDNTGKPLVTEMFLHGYPVTTVLQTEYACINSVLQCSSIVCYKLLHGFDQSIALSL